MVDPNEKWKRLLLTDWSQGATVLLAGFFLLQYLNWISEEETLWLAETVTLSKWTLFFVCATYFVPRIYPLVRLLLQLLLVVYIHTSLLGYEYTGMKISSLAALKKWFILNFNQIEPFIWFSLGTWIALLFVLWMTQAKSRIYLMIIASVLFFAIRDSFSALVLWQQVSIILFCGLSLLIVRHFSELKIRAPKSWEALAEYPAAIGIPIVLLIAVTILIGALAPSMQPVLTDPYTAWKISRGESFTPD